MDDRPTEDAPEAELQLSVGELAERAGVTRRTIRFYVQRGLLPPPLGGGRGSYYTEAHLLRLLAVKQLQERGLPLEVVQRRLDEGEAPEVEAPAAPPRELGETWRRYALVPGVELLARDGALSARELEAVVQAARAALSAPATYDGAHAGPERARRDEPDD